MLDQHIIDSILDKIDIVELIGSRIGLKKAGRNFKGSCPFHNEKTPSFIVSPEKQIYHCFGCSAGGNAISFLMKYEKLDFREAMSHLSVKTGISLPKDRNIVSETGKYERYYKINFEASVFYHGTLASGAGKQAKRYLTDRGLTEATIELFKIGYSLNLWDSLIKKSEEKKIGLKDLSDCGLVLMRENKTGYYDRFRNRIMFPIFDLKDRVIGFGARAFGDSHPKYMNSPETPVYHKSKTLYGLNFSKQYIREKGFTVIVEGYLDFLLPFQHGIRNVAATLGTALTKDQAIMLRKLAKTVVIVYDADSAGEEASLRGLDMLISNEINVRIATLPKGEDPDSFVRKYGAEKLESVINTSKDLFEYKMGLLMKRYNKDGVRGRAAIATLMLPTISRLRNDILKASYLKKMSDELSIDESALWSELKKVKPDYSHVVNIRTNDKKNTGLKKAEEIVVSLVLDDPELIDVVFADLSIDDFSDFRVSRILSAVKGLREKGEAVKASRLISALAGDDVEGIIAKAAADMLPSIDKEKALIDCFCQIKSDRLEPERSLIKEKVRAAEQNNDHDLALELSRKSNRMDMFFKKLKDVRISKSLEKLKALNVEYDELLMMNKG